MTTLVAPGAPPVGAGFGADLHILMNGHMVDLRRLEMLALIEIAVVVGQWRLSSGFWFDRQFGAQVAGSCVRWGEGAALSDYEMRTDVGGGMHNSFRVEDCAGEDARWINFLRKEQGEGHGHRSSWIFDANENF